MRFAQQKGMSVAQNLSRIRESLGANPVKLIAVTKTATPGQIEEAFECGVTEFGENRVQEAVKKQNALPPRMASQVNWHFIGHLQTNKVKQAVGKFVLIHSVDSFRLAEEISKTAQAKNIVQPILLQVKVVDDESKGGFSPDELRHAFPQIHALAGIEIKGLMTITPLTADEKVRANCFDGLKDLRDELEAKHNVTLTELSMGMSDDYGEALSHGATMVRIGRAIFEG